MFQLPLLDDQNPKKIVNIATVPHRSPFRYPGGKTWLIPVIRKWLLSYIKRPKNFYEPFAGGGIVALSVAFENLAKKVTLVELDEDVAAVWLTILSDDRSWLIQRIMNFELTINNVKTEINKDVFTTREHAFQTILKNRTFHGGILAPGSGLIKNGENGKGILSRWYPKTICKRINNIGVIKDKISFIHGDGLDFIETHRKEMDSVYFIDPPYTVGGKNAGARLYKYFDLDHEFLFQLMNKMNENNFLMTYDNSNEVVELATKYLFQTELIPMRNTHHSKMTELLIAKDLSWY